MQNPKKVAIKQVIDDTITLLMAACHISASLKILRYHSNEKFPKGMVGNLCELKEKMILNAIGVKIKTKIKNK